MIISNSHTRALKVIDAHTIDKGIARLETKNKVAFFVKPSAKKVVKVLDDPKAVVKPDLDTLD